MIWFLLLAAVWLVACAYYTRAESLRDEDMVGAVTVGWSVIMAAYFCYWVCCYCMGW